ncbi:hypothetical protein PVAP13_2KG200890 [Panicum virgatum]|uniref:Uncharacterized protein n=1 Tax=Panicum virgatum TaxID=38727 RepID=A0A8T0WC49_PANVG|nr:hypothetical protein PVAP13_2KG200890 [Panicum virgatum]
MCLSIYETADGKIQLMKGQPIGTTNRADMVFQKKYIGCLWVSLRIEISLLNYLSAILFWGQGLRLRRCCSHEIQRSLMILGLQRYIYNRLGVFCQGGDQFVESQSIE